MSCARSRSGFRALEPGGDELCAQPGHGNAHQKAEVGRARRRAFRVRRNFMPDLMKVNLGRPEKECPAVVTEGHGAHAKTLRIKGDRAFGIGNGEHQVVKRQYKVFRHRQFVCAKS